LHCSRQSSKGPTVKGHLNLRIRGGAIHADFGKYFRAGGDMAVAAGNLELIAEYALIGTTMMRNKKRDND
jgi:hypothetical protein